ncbi:hypothetical protein [Cellulomonas cellasea]|uniref:Uncharacterized protein n=1 Tax=Cellulomonas cellasea DSM 20118 TaxID=1408250 RepID=A0A0A0BCS4_9CELL|nr:hypothetical protein [Cellulomonas cellasea]KGM03699.1 hypothetical protein Q760_15730 [Cellulomonas cellasea DSM 20118]
MTSTAEYDAFGPWIDEVRSPQDVPRLFRAHPLDLDAVHLVLKVPRNISRRDATADMDLYDHLIVLADDELSVLTRLDALTDAGEPPASVYDQALGYRTWSSRPGDVVALRDVTSMLDARLDLLTQDGRALTVRYNGSAAEGVQRLVDAIRTTHDGGSRHDGSTSDGAGAAPVALTKPAAGSRPSPYSPASSMSARPADPPLAPSALGLDDVGLVHSYREVARRLPDLRLLALHPRRRVRPAASDAVAHVLHAASPATLHGAVVGQDERWLEVLGRRTWLTRGRAPDHSRSRLTIARSAIRDVRAAPHPVYGGVTQVTLTLVLGGPGVEVAVPTGSDAERVLLAAR